jgi:hypothetical protein
VLLMGTYMMRGEVNGRLLDALPPLWWSWTDSSTSS